MKSFDLIVIGAGPGGYVAAIRAAQLGKKVAIVEKNALGGTCLNTGCIPSKTLLQHGEAVETIQKANDWGIQTGEISINFGKLMGRKDQVIRTLTNGVDYLLKKNKVTLFKGTATVDESLVVTVGSEKLKGKDLLLATGSKPFVPPINGLDEVDYLTTDNFFNLEELPESMVIIGGGVIAVELAFAMAPLGTNVTIIEVAQNILLTEDPDAREVIKGQLKAKGIQTITGAEIQRVTEKEVVLADQTISFDRLLVAAGRSPNRELALDLQLQLDENEKFVVVNEQYETSKKHIYAIGDLIGGYQLAHAASAEGIIAVHAMAGEPIQPIEQTKIPRCVYTQPEIASFGLNEEQAKRAGFDVEVTKTPLAGNGKAIAMDSTAGFIKIIADRKFGEILGAVIVGHGATEWVGELLAMKHTEGTMHELASMIHAHPTISEAIGESANLFFKQAIHM
ncbi:dihydrolipoyl dehydrogenase [Sporosarcina sp. HYO08]|uniref:dihydrolipoyl dehydrogenase n=1 Tax=Sporosarcina sp. HYO08 TaxID=1759557 RepID=UPI0007973753|nr:dihydrolipoyl dehydrogenase [Sporosarcina sp. HYO08]KXH82011.1 acetoin dehydrogenase [Sporosarcina sp. HYO08]